MSAIFASLDHLTAGHARNKASVDQAIDAVVSAHQHGGKDAFDARVGALRSAITNAFATMDAVCDTARTAVGMPVGVDEATLSSDARIEALTPAPAAQRTAEAATPSKKA